MLVPCDLVKPKNPNDECSENAMDSGTLIWIKQSYLLNVQQYIDGLSIDYLETEVENSLGIIIKNKKDEQKRQKEDNKYENKYFSVVLLRSKQSQNI